MAPNGTLDNTVMGGAGLNVFLAQCRALGFTRRPDGEYVIAGTDITGPSFCSGSARATNGAAGWVFNRPFGNSAQFTAVASSTDNRTFIVGFGGGSMDKFASIDRVTVAGTADPAWNGGAPLRFEDPATPDGFIYQFKAVTTDALGRVIIGGNKNNAGMTLIRLWP